MTDIADTDSFWMSRALAEAARGQGAVEPNPMVGAVLVRNGQLVGVGHHARFGGPHAEAAALAASGQHARGATLYVTLEPCCHHGKTPPCADAIIAAGVNRVVAALTDPFPKVAGGGFTRLREAGVQVAIGTGDAVARRLNAPYLKRIHTGRPFVIAKWAMTLDGKTATATGDSRWISNERSRTVVHDLRGRVDAVIIGIATALADDPDLTARPPGPRLAARVVLDSTARLPLTSRLALSAAQVPVHLFVGKDAPHDRQTALAHAPNRCLVVQHMQADRFPIPALLDNLGESGMTNVLVEGGGTVLGAFFDANEVDAVEVFIAPIIEGGSHAHNPARGRGVSLINKALRLIHLEHAWLDGDVHLRGLVDRPWLAPAAAIDPP